MKHFDLAGKCWQGDGQELYTGFQQGYNMKGDESIHKQDSVSGKAVPS